MEETNKNGKVISIRTKTDILHIYQSKCSSHLCTDSDIF